MSAKKDEENLLATIIFCFSRLQLNMRHFRIERVQKNISASKQYTLKYSKNICICYLFTLFLSFSNSLQYCNFWLLSFSLLSNSLVLLLASTFFSYPFFLQLLLLLLLRFYLVQQFLALSVSYFRQECISETCSVQFHHFFLFFMQYARRTC